MEIKILQLIEGAKTASGLTVIIDVFRAFSVACYLYKNGAKTIIPVGSIDTAYRLKKENPSFVLMGERGGRKQPGFDFGNSPAQVENADFTGKTIIHTTGAGTQGIVNATKADEIITGSFVNAKAVAEYIKSAAPGTVSLVCMGNAGVQESDEDTFCAEYIKSLLEGKNYDVGGKIASLRSGSGRRFFNPANADWSPERDFYLCTDVDRFDFILKAQKCDSNFITGDSKPIIGLNNTLNAELSLYRLEKYLVGR